MSMTLWDLIDDYRAKTGATEAAIQRRAGLNHGTFTAWRQRGVPVLPERRALIGLADALHVDYERVLVALLHTAKYLPEGAARQANQELLHAEAIAEEVDAELRRMSPGEEARLRVEAQSLRMPVYVYAAKFGFDFDRAEGSLERPVQPPTRAAVVKKERQVREQRARLTVVPQETAARKGTNQGKQLRDNQDTAETGNQDPGGVDPA